MSGVLSLFGFLGCGDEAGAGDDLWKDTAPFTCDGAPASVTIGGTGTDDSQHPTWVEMPAGSEQTMVHGPQGGWHILASADVQGTNPIVTIRYQVFWPAHDEARLSDGLFRVMLVPDDRCGGYYAGMFGILDVSEVATGDANTPPELLAGETLRLTLDIVDLDGLTAHDEVSVVAGLDPADVDAQ